MTEMEGMVKHESSWKCADLETSSDWVYQITDEDINEIDNALAHLKSNEITGYRFNKEFFVLTNFKKTLQSISDYVEKKKGVFLIKGLPVDKYSLTDTKLIYAGIANYMGYLMEQSIEHKELMHEVKDRGTRLTDKKGRGTSTTDSLPFHTDRIDLLSLLCINRAKTGGQTMAVSAMAIRDEIERTRPDLLELLYQPYYHARVAWEASEENLYYAMPVFAECEGHFATRYLRHFINVAQDISGVPQMSAQQIEALDYFEQIARNPEFHVAFDLQPGEMLFLNNYVTLHSRTEYLDHVDPAKKRMLLRTWLSVPNSRPLADSFAPLFYNTGAGEIRGGLPQSY